MDKVIRNFKKKHVFFKIQTRTWYKLGIYKELKFAENGLHISNLHTRALQSTHGPPFKRE